MKIVDISVYHENGASEPYPPTIEHSSHEAGATRLGKLIGIGPEAFPDSRALATDRISGSTHSGTHIDAPLHYSPVTEGKPSRTVDEVPLEWMFGDGVILDMRHKRPGEEITVEDLKEALVKIKYKLKPMDIVLLHTGCDKYWGTDSKTYLHNQSGLGVSGLVWLLDQGIKVIGIDAWTLDRPTDAMVATYKETGDKNALWPVHLYGKNTEYIQIEKLCNLDKIPVKYGFTVSAFPVKFKGCTAAWCRAVAIIND